MKTEIKGWEPILDCPPSDNFVCRYEGNFAQNLLINRPLVEKFLRFAGFDGRVLLTESHVKRPRSIPDGINPDGSVAGRGSLFWGERVQTEDSKVNPYIQIDSDDAGWTILINGTLITEDLSKNVSAGSREGEIQFATTFDQYLKEGLAKVALKDKCTFAKDPYLSGRAIVTFAVFCGYFIVAKGDQLHPMTVFPILGYILFNGMQLFSKGKGSHIEDQQEWREALNIIGKVVTPFRRNVKSIWETTLWPFEIDRLALAEGYLGYRNLRGTPLVKAASSS